MGKGADNKQEGKKVKVKGDENKNNGKKFKGKG
jgi:hypothetical protein